MAPMTPAQRRYYESPKGKAQRANWYAANAERLSIQRAANVERIRGEAIDKYGGVCTCCGESEKAFLCFDHVDGGGRAERSTRKTHGVGWYRELVSMPQRTDLQVLCANCNLAKERASGCPHQRTGELR